MNPCDEPLATILSTVARDFTWRCRPLGDSTGARVSTGRLLADGEPVQLLVRVRAGMLVVSDGGETLSRLQDQGLDRSDPVLDALWVEALRTYRLQETDGRVFIQAPLARAAQALNRFADALVALDALRVAALPARGRRPTLADEVEAYLRSIYDEGRVRRAPTVRLGGGLTIRPALQVDTQDRSGVLVQSGAATSTTQSFDHAYALFGLAARGGVPLPNRLVVLGGAVESWNASRLRALSDVAFVGFWRHRERVHRFLDGDIPDDPLLTPEGMQIPLLPTQ